MLHLKLPFAKTATAKRSKLFLLALALSAFTPFAGIAQKIEANKIFTSLKKAPVMKLKPEFNTYSVTYDFGTLPLQAKEKPELQDLKFQESGGDLNLKITFNKLFIIDKIQKTEGTKPTPPKPGTKPQKAASPAEPPKFYSIVNYMANYGYDLIDKKSETTLYAFKKKNDSFTTPTFNSVAELDAYLKNSLETELQAHILDKINKRIKYDFAPQNFEVRVAVNSVTGPSPAFTEINKASTDFAALVSEKTPTKEAIQPQIAVWEKHLATADWKGKGAINKKVANALIENLCAAYMLTGDFGKLREKVDLFEKNNPGAGSISALTFEADSNYPGSNPSVQAIKRKDKTQNYIKSNFHEFSHDLAGA
ncbi:hypothetical protein I5M27_10990 [Adhaeribacter sp. BT258]|uniref:Uncharacterized protein n=1 Tax=Adhaeribacter terrigena TaxID=2793070 RepID=A0ABS1C286_9BACT|nr:hypothetical protein [Adhaeribacter terrigena]MBK0403513.1 hypothetical protein [Adhaeribacter terrigena]